MLRCDWISHSCFPLSVGKAVDGLEGALDGIVVVRRIVQGEGDFEGPRYCPRGPPKHTPLYNHIKPIAFYNLT